MEKCNMHDRHSGRSCWVCTSSHRRRRSEAGGWTRRLCPVESRNLQPLCICSHQVTRCMVGGRLWERTPRNSDLEVSLRFWLLALLDDFGIALDSGTICISRTVVLHASSATLPELAGTGLPVSTVFFAHTTTTVCSAFFQSFLGNGDLARMPSTLLQWNFQRKQSLTFSDCQHVRGTVPVPRVIKDMVGRVENNTQKVNIITYDMLIKRSRLESPGGETRRSTDMTKCRFKKGEGTKTWAQNLRPIEAIGHKIKSYTPKVQPPLFYG